MALRKAISLQTQFLGRFNVVVAGMTQSISSRASHYSFTAFWHALEQLSGDGELCIRTYDYCLSGLEATQPSEGGRLFVEAVGDLFMTKVGDRVGARIVHVFDNTELPSLVETLEGKMIDRTNGGCFFYFCLTPHLPMCALLGQGRLDAAEPKLRKNLSMSRRLYAPSDTRVWTAMLSLASLLRSKVST